MVGLRIKDDHRFLRHGDEHVAVRPETDWVVESPTGEMVASAPGWLDDENKVGLVEPVGCVPEHRRRGLGVAVNVALLNAFRQQGATIAVVLPRGDEGYPGPGELYRKVGFKPGSRTFTYVRNTGTPKCPPVPAGCGAGRS